MCREVRFSVLKSMKLFVLKSRCVYRNVYIIVTIDFFVGIGSCKISRVLNSCLFFFQ